jgi:hypothetical protein
MLILPCGSLPVGAVQNLALLSEKCMVWTRISPEPHGPGRKHCGGRSFSTHRTAAILLAYLELVYVAGPSPLGKHPCRPPHFTYLLQFFYHSYSQRPIMSDSINTTTIMSASDDSKSPLTFDHDSKKLTIIFGTFATLLALFGLVFAALTWYTPRRRPSAQLRAPNGHELESNLIRHGNLLARDSPGAVNTNSEYGRTSILPNVHELTSGSNAGAPPSSLAMDSSPNNADTIVPMPLRHQSLCEDRAVIQHLSNNANPSMSTASSQEKIHIVNLAYSS